MAGRFMHARIHCGPEICLRKWLLFSVKPTSLFWILELVWNLEDFKSSCS